MDHKPSDWSKIIFQKFKMKKRDSIKVYQGWSKLKSNT